ncbi:1-acyl-sn-glycerol-3-phosphate acyltransferase [Curvibacter sp. CHRR-16]|nr:1-acyl-sn-glycerol-3-phosphate acyltransferase [Curvibacter sp. CHRR-16]
MAVLRAGWRMLRVVAHLSLGLARAYWQLPRLTQAQREQVVQAWAQAMLRHIGIRVQVLGQPAAGPVMLVANHISWLDIVVMHAAQYCRFLSKSEVHHWPVVGRLADAAGTLYIERDSRRDAMRVMHHMVERLQAGDVLAVFPEGTTGDGTDVLPFHANLLQAAISAGVAVQPIGLRFVDANGALSLAPCYVGDDSLLESLWRTLCANGLVAQVHFGEPQLAQERDRRAWAQDLRQAVIALR